MEWGYPTEKNNKKVKNFFIEMRKKNGHTFLYKVHKDLFGRPLDKRSITVCISGMR